MNSEVGTRSE